MDAVTDALHPAVDPAPDPAPMREQYHTRELAERDLAAHPMDQFARWFADAASHGDVHEPNAMVVATATPDGRPSARTVLMKHFDARGFVFFTNYDSRKGAELAANPYASLLFPWHPIARQVVVTGPVSRVGRDETAAYFRTRPHGSQLGAWASAQSSVIGSRAELLARYEELAARHPESGQVPVPPHWGGFLVAPETVEFWQGHENRLHDRLRYVRLPGAGGDGGGWRVERLAP
ncbi:pyridoxamine 5'-phosphate oxidase [Streptomyces somaliensis]|uniref:pyridoxamine 5'-phosphate oxidase n=1 Tax=Streptomyces somaliensis TaxID=78355 RepID=UPI0020CD28F4|nr:pyridoxamine 5'-phosphate oxidase [Streptomyces somaliensis]MCP9944236.1 pyridoxamine 5'-phosphate oxidase [Streptomyces somaliensis]MCP9975356.1 pyridoxamine 5'-phosphate oxidase [Streptomyces somaliensis]